MGKGEHLWKRNGIYYFRAKIGGVLVSRSLGPVSKESALKTARELYKLEAEKRWAILEANKLRDTYSLLGDVFDTYRAACARKGDPRPVTVDRNIWALAKLIRVVNDNYDMDVSKVRASVLTEDLVERYAAKLVAAAGNDAVLEGRARRSLCSMVRQARSLFAAHTRTVYRSLSLPNLEGFLKADIGRDPKKRYKLPPKILRERTLEEGEKLAESNPGLHAAFSLCYHLGLRAGEAAAARWSWFEVKGDGRVFLHVIERPEEDFRQKGYAGTIPVPLAVWRRLDAARKSANPYVLPGPHKTAREDLVGRDLAGWMRSIGWDQQTYPKAAHELRKLIGSLWYKKFGADGARERLRHANIQTTLDFYAQLDYEELQALDVAEVA